MKTTIFYFSSDDDNGMRTELFTTRESLVKAIHDSVECRDAEASATMRTLPFESEEWSFHWFEHVEQQEKKTNFYHFGAQALELPTTATS